MPPDQQYTQPQQTPMGPQGVQPAPKNKAILFVIVGIVLVALIAVGAYFLLMSQGKAPTATGPSSEAVSKYSPSIIDKIKGIDAWQNGHFVVEGGHGLPEVPGTFVKTDQGYYTVADVNRDVVAQKSDEMSKLAPAAQSGADDVATRPALYTGNEYQLDMLGLMTQIGYGLDFNVVTYLEELLKALGDPQKNPEYVACNNDLANYRSKANAYLASLQPNYVFDEKYKSYQWHLDTTELFQKLSIKQQSPACAQFLEKFLKSSIENERLAGTQLIFEIAEETDTSITLIVFVAPPKPSENYEKMFKVKITEKNAAPAITTFASDPTSLFSRRSAFAITTSQCNALPVIALTHGATKNGYVTTVQPTLYKGPQIRDYGYFCTPKDAEADGYIPIKP